MKKFKIFSVLSLLSIFCLCGVQVNAAYVPCVGVSLQKDQKSVTSAYKMLDASYMYGETTSASKYKVTYEAKASNNYYGSFTTKETKSYAPGKSGSVSLTKYSHNYWKITLTGNTTSNAKKKCIAFGKVSE